MTEAVLRADKLGKCFHTAEAEVAAVQEVSFEVQGGEFVALHGPSGCGKSTLLLMCGGLLSPGEGTVEIAGQNLYALTPERRAGFRAAQLGFVFQQFHLVPYLTVLENVRVGELARAGSLEQEALKLLERFQLSHRLNHKPAALSVGEQQRVALARALAHSPRILFADEPTGNLDAGNAAIILDEFAAFAAQGGAVLLVTHDEAARARAQRSLRLVQGRLADAT
jgi:putative ABC transport system ATP-binding protein